MAMKEPGVMPNGHNSLGGRKPAMPATGGGKGYGSNPPAGAPANADISAGKSTPGPSKDLGSRPSIDACHGTHVGSTADMTGKCPVARRSIKADAK